MVEYLTIFDKQYPVRIGYLVMKRIKEKTSKGLQEAIQEAKDDPRIHEIILFAALEMGAYADKKELDLKEEERPMILDLVFPQYLKLFSSASFFPKEVYKEAEEQMKELGEAKPKVQKKKSKKTTT